MGLGVSQGASIFWSLKHSYESGDIPNLSYFVVPFLFGFPTLLSICLPCNSVWANGGLSLPVYSCNDVLILGMKSELELIGVKSPGDVVRSEI